MGRDEQPWTVDGDAFDLVVGLQGALLDELLGVGAVHRGDEGLALDAVATVGQVDRVVGRDREVLAARVHRASRAHRDPVQQAEALGIAGVVGVQADDARAEPHDVSVDLEVEQLREGGPVVVGEELDGVAVRVGAAGTGQATGRVSGAPGEQQEQREPGHRSFRRSSA